MVSLTMILTRSSLELQSVLTQSPHRNPQGDLQAMDHAHQIGDESETPCILKELPSCQLANIYPAVCLSDIPFAVIDDEMRGYQLQGLNWMVPLHHIGFNGILADERYVCHLLLLPS